MKYRILICLLFLATSAVAQNNKFTKYYDSTWQTAPKDVASFYTEFEKHGSVYNCTSYWVSSGKLFCKSSFKDTSFSHPIGILKRYYEDGQIQDSTFHHDNGKIKETYHYYPNGKLWAHIIYNKKEEAELSDGFTIDGKPIRNFIFFKEAEFADGIKGWIEYLTGSLKTDIPIKNGAPNGTYQVVIRFIIDKNGKVAGTEAETKFGYGMEEEAIRVISKSPRWTPLIVLGEKQNAFRRQPLTFIVK